MDCPHGHAETESKTSKTAAHVPTKSRSQSESFFYFIHSYHFELNTTIDSIGLSNYGKEFVSFIKFKNIYGIQSHPEKSQLVGLNFLGNFVNGN